MQYGFSKMNPELEKALARGGVIYLGLRGRAEKGRGEGEMGTWREGVWGEIFCWGRTPLIAKSQGT